MTRLRALSMLLSGLLALAPMSAQAAGGIGMIHPRTAVDAVTYGQIAPASGLEMVARTMTSSYALYNVTTGAVITPLPDPFTNALDLCYPMDLDGDGYDELICVANGDFGPEPAAYTVLKFVGGALVAKFPPVGLKNYAQFVGLMRLNAANPKAAVFAVANRLQIVGQTGVMLYDSGNDASWPNENGATITAQIGSFAGTGYEQVAVSLTPALQTDLPYEMLIGDVSLPTADASEAAPGMARLMPSRPNPATGPVRIGFALPSAAQVQLMVYDAQGRMVSRLANGRMEAGQHESLWDGRDVAGTRVQPGAYFYELVVDGAKETRKLIQLR